MPRKSHPPWSDPNNISTIGCPYHRHKCRKNSQAWPYQLGIETTNIKQFSSRLLEYKAQVTCIWFSLFFAYLTRLYQLHLLCSMEYDTYRSKRGRAIAQAVSRRLPNGATRVRSCGICSEQSGTGTGFLRVLSFPLPIHIPPIAPRSPSGLVQWLQY
jgi:hypothetical protein